MRFVLFGMLLVLSPAVGGHLTTAQPVSRLDPVDPQEGIFFGWSVAVDASETWLAVSAPSAGAPVTAGRVDLYEATGDGWSDLTSLTDSDAVEGDDFGSSLTGAPRRIAGTGSLSGSILGCDYDPIFAAGNRPGQNRGVRCTGQTCTEAR